MRTRRIPLMLRAIEAIVRPVLALTTKHDWRGMEHLPRTGGFVLSPNHVSYVDPLTFAHFMIANDVPPRFLAKDSLFKLKVLGWILSKAEQIPVYRLTERASEAFSAGVEAVKRGEAVAIYPEGTMTRDPDGWPMSGKTGAVRVALESGCPLIPAAQWGPQEIMWGYRKGFHLFPRKTMRVLVGSPVDLDGFRGKPLTTELLVAATDVLMDAITLLLIELRGERPTGDRIDLHTVNHPKTSDPEVES